MNEWNYFVAGILLMVGIDAGLLIRQLFQKAAKNRKHIEELTGRLGEQSDQIAKLKERLDIHDCASRRARPDMGYNDRAEVLNVTSDLELLAMNNKRDRDLIETAIARTIMIQKGDVKPDKPNRDYLKERSNL